MAQYIDKSALVAEIKRLHEAHSGKYGCDEVGLNLEYLEDFLDTLEVKEVDLKKEFEDYLNNVEGQPRIWHSDEQIEWAKNIACHFYGLGLKARKEEVE